MSQFFKKHYHALIGWILALVIAVVALPNVGELTTQNSAVKLPDNVQTQLAETMKNQWSDSQKDTTEAVIVFHNEGNALSQEQKDRIKETVDKLRQNESEYGIKSMTASMDNEYTQKQLISQDETTQLLQLNIDKNHGTLSEIENQLNEAAKTDGVTTYVTGADILTNAFSQKTQDGIKKTEVIAVIFIFIVLILVFRSPVVPLVSIATVAVSFIVSLSIVTNLVAHFGFPFSNFTQVFMVVVLFGIGTDYNILLYDEFKDQLSLGVSNSEAMQVARKKAGHTILYSGTSVLIGFAVLGLAQFSIYQSAVGVAVGIAVLIPVLLTLNAFFMVTLGKKLFWPAKSFEGHSTSKFWHMLSKNSVLRPILSLLIVLVIMLPLSFMYSNHLNYDDLDELGNDTPAKVGFEVVQAHFSKGTAEPTTLYIQSDETLDNTQNLKDIDSLTQAIKAIPGVKTVTSATQPGGDQIDKLYVDSQMKTVNSGISEAQKGAKDLQTGLVGNGQSSQNNGQLPTDLLTGVNNASSGLTQLQSGSQQLVDGLTQLNDKLASQTSGQSQSQITQLVDGLPQINSAIQQLNGALQNAGTSGVDTSSLTQKLSQVAAHTKAIGDELTQAGQTLTGLQAEQQQQSAQYQQMLSQLPESARQAIVQKDQKVQQALAQVGQNIQNAGSHDQQIGQQLQAVSQDSQLSGMMQQLTTLKQQVQTLADKSNVALPGATQALNQLYGGLTQVQSAVAQGNTGAQALNGGLTTMTQQLPQMVDGVKKAGDGAGQLNTGLGTAYDYLNNYQNSASAKTFYIPSDQIHGEEFQKSLDTYLSSDKKTTKLMIILDENPSSDEAIQKINELTNQTKGILQNGSLNNAQVAFGGQTAKIADTQKTANDDFIRTAMIMVLGIGIALIFVTRSILQPLYILGTLLLAFLSSMTITKWVSATFLGHELLTWNTPFFTFIMIFALGVDYSIFLMMKYREFGAEGLQPSEQIIKACEIIGAVVISAAIILGGTFAALIPSGVLTLIQVALGVIIGLLILVVILPMILSAAIRLTYETFNFKKLFKKDK
ncbi:MMPL family transporter [Holzapfeliella sp. JNUCC 80]